jgi:hypothetical protein
MFKIIYFKLILTHKNALVNTNRKIFVNKNQNMEKRVADRGRGATVRRYL